jgi:hypothetical protein
MCAASCKISSGCSKLDRTYPATVSVASAWIEVQERRVDANPRDPLRAGETAGRSFHVST